MDRWTDKRVVTGWALLAATTCTLLVSSVWAGDRAGQRTHDRDVKVLTACVATTRTAAECRVLVNGAP